jgi:hypothetical protein
MNERTFLHQLRRGLGSAIVELQENQQPQKYKEILLRCCLKDIGYDVQIEGTKGEYLYTAICALGGKDEFEDAIIDAFMKRLDYRLFQQLADILCLYAEDGSEKAKNALRIKYQSLAKQLLRQKTFPYRYSEHEQFEYLMIYEVDTYKWSAFKKCIADASHISMMRKDDACDDYDWFFAHCQRVFGKERIERYFDEILKKMPESKAFIVAINESRRMREENSRLRVEPEVTLESYISRAGESENDRYAYIRMRIVAMRLSRQSNQDDLKKLVSIIIDEQSDEIKARLLQVFRTVDFPADIDILINYAESGCERLQDSAVDALERFKDKRIHDLAVKFITSGNLDAGLSLLVKNLKKQDEALLRVHILSSKKMPHAVQQGIRDIYSKRRSKSCGDILEHVYRYGECTFCRADIVRAMWKSRVLRADILNECLYDSYDETREMARRIKRIIENGTVSRK